MVEEFYIREQILQLEQQCEFIRGIVGASGSGRTQINILFNLCYIT